MSTKRLPPVAPPPAPPMSVVASVEGRRFTEDLATQSTITPNIEAVNDGLATNPARFAEWAMLEALARGEHDRLVGAVATLDADIKELEAKIFLEVVEQGGYTVDGIKAKVTTDPRRLELSQRRRELSAAVIEAKANLDKVSVGRKTMEMKKDSLISLANNWRQEMQTQLTVRLGQVRESVARGGN